MVLSLLVVFTATLLGACTMGSDPARNAQVLPSYARGDAIGYGDAVDRFGLPSPNPPAIRDQRFIESRVTHADPSKGAAGGFVLINSYTGGVQLVVRRIGGEVRRFAAAGTQRSVSIRGVTVLLSPPRDVSADVHIRGMAVWSHNGLLYELIADLDDRALRQAAEDVLKSLGISSGAAKGAAER